MDINIENTTFIIVTYKSEKIVHSCLDSLPENSNKIVIENSQNLQLKKDLEITYKNLKVIINENLGFGASNNLGIKECNTQFAYILNPDVTFKKDTFDNLCKSCLDISDFSIVSPIHSDKNYPNYKIKKKYNFISDNIIEVDDLDGFSMLVNKNNFDESDYFDENFFLYLENNDLCLRVKKNNQKIYVIKNSIIEHRGGASSDPDFSQIEYLKNWHWMWSKFYYHHKHDSYLYAFMKIFKNLISAFIKTIFYTILRNNKKKDFYKARLSGCINGLLLKKSWYRID
jgi:N-acetylglucosaminyl-diphospho-decaprenol L-rhamnosyltransferase